MVRVRFGPAAPTSRSSRTSAAPAQDVLAQRDLALRRVPVTGHGQAPHQQFVVPSSSGLRPTAREANATASVARPLASSVTAAWCNRASIAADRR